MKKFNILFTIIFGTISCSTLNYVVYEGNMNYYMPNGDIESHKAMVTESFEYNMFGDKINFKEEVRVYPSNGYDLIFYSNIPYKFEGRINYNLSDIKTNTISENSVDYSYNGKSYRIPMSVISKIQKKYMKDGKVDNAKAEKELEKYIKEHFKE